MNNKFLLKKMNLQFVIIILMSVSITQSKENDPHYSQSGYTKSEYSQKSNQYKAEYKPLKSPHQGPQNEIKCVLDRNTTRGDFLCSMQTCYNFTSGMVSSYRSFCYRIRNGMASIEERSDRLIMAYHKPWISLYKHLRETFEYWVGIELLERLWKMAIAPFFPV